MYTLRIYERVGNDNCILQEYTMEQGAETVTLYQGRDI